MTDQSPLKLHPSMTVQIPALALPGFRSSYAIQQGIEKNLILKTWGGLGDQICAEPTLRFALKTFKGCDISLASEHPTLFRHLAFKNVYDLKKVQPLWENYFPFDTIRPPTDIQWQFMSHMLVNCVDYPALCAFRMQLPTADREVHLAPTPEDFDFIHYRVNAPASVAVHAGRHWPSKTFPKWFWDEVLDILVRQGGLTPILIGADTDDNRGTVDVDTSGCIDLRNQLSVMQSVALLQAVPVLLTNDSAPLHMAASGDAAIGFIATCKHPDLITHWRAGKWAHKMQNFGRGGIWDVLDFCPNKDSEVSGEFVPDDLLKSWLPDPKTFADWAITHAKERTGWKN
jgi:hypothetical protein